MVNNLFFSTLDGVQYKDVYNQILNLDRTVFSYNERLKNVEKITRKNPYLQKFFDSYYDPHLKQGDSLSKDHNICHLVEMLTNYLLMSNESKAIEAKDKTFYIDADKLGKGKDTAQDIIESLNINNYLVVKFNKENITNQKQVVITAKDLSEKSKCGNILRDLQEAKDEATYKIKNGIGNRFKLSKLKHQLKEDQLQTKISLKGIFALNTSPTFCLSTDNNYITISDLTVAKYLLNMQKQNDVNVCWLDFKRLLMEVPFTERDKEILYMYSQGFPINDIAYDFGITHQFVTKKIKKLVKRISKYNHLKQSNCLKDKFNI